MLRVLTYHFGPLSNPVNPMVCKDCKDTAISVMFI